MENEGEGVVVEHGGRAFPCAQAPCKVAEMVAAQGNVGSLGFTDGLAVVQCFHQCQMVEVCVDDISDLQKNVLSFDWRSLGPFRKSCSCCLDSCVYVFLGCFCEICEMFPVSRVVCVKCSSIRCGNEFTVDEKTILLLNACFCHKITFLSVKCRIFLPFL